MFDLAAYIPDAFLPQYVAFRDTLVSWLETFGIAKGIDSGDSAGSLIYLPYEWKRLTSGT